MAPVRCAPAAVEANIAGRYRLRGGWKSFRSVFAQSLMTSLEENWLEEG